MTATDELAGFTRAICADPLEDTLRMVVADWFDEHGDPDRAEFVRDQVEWREGSRDWDLLDAHWGRWFPNSRRNEEVGFQRQDYLRGIDVTLSCGTVVTFSRGFPSRVRWSRVEAYTSAARSGYWARQPVTRVEIADRVPDEVPLPGGVGSCWRWYDQGEHERSPRPYLLPSELWRAFHDTLGRPSLIRRNESWEYPSAWAAYEALSAGAVSLGRKLAGLPVLFGGES